MKHLPLPEGYRWKLVHGTFVGTVRVKLQKKGRFVWHTKSDSLYGLFKGQKISESSILIVERKLWNDHEESYHNIQWIKDNL